LLMPHRPANLDLSVSGILHLMLHSAQARSARV